MTAMNYTRKRALLACDFCRHRKRRCDGERPCSTCRESSADCRYKDLPVERVDPSPGSGEAVSEQLNRIEEMLRRLMNQNAPNDAGVIITDEGPDASEPMMTYPLTETSGSYTTTSPPVSIAFHNYPYDYSQGLFSDFPQPALLYYDSITTSTGSSAPIISLSLAPPAMPPVSTMSMPMTSTPLLSVPSVSLTPSLTPAPSSSPASPASQPRTLNSLSPDSAFLPLYNTGFGLTNIPAVPPSDTSPPQQQAQLLHQSHHHQNRPNQESQQLVIPREDFTAADSLLSLPEIEFLISTSRHLNSDDKGIKVGQDTVPVPDLPLSRTHFYDIEASLPLQKELNLFYSPGPWLSAWPLPITDQARTDKITAYVQAYFTNVYPNTPLVNIGQYAELSKGMFDDAVPDRDALKGSDHSIQKAICLAIWAIGALVTGSPNNDNDNDNDKSPERDALLYFQPAFKIIQHHALWEFGPPSLAVCQALLLAASYFAHIGRPLYNARLVHLAGRQLVRLYKQTRDDRDFCIAFWVCFLWESDRAAEFDVPLSGVIELAADMPMPVQGATDDLEAMIYFNAEIAVRKISNQTRDWLYGQAAASEPPMRDVHDAQPTLKRRRGDDGLSAVTPSLVPSSIPSSIISPAASTPTIHTTLNASTELNLRLDAWYRVIPQNVQPPLQGNVYDRQGSPVQKSIKSLKNEKGRNSSSPSSDIKLLPLRAQILRAQYYAARHLIHRPFVLALAAHQKQAIEARERRKLDSSRKTKTKDTRLAPLPPAVLEKCAVCVDSCLMFLINILPLLDHRSPYLWSFCQTSVACLVVLLVVQACPPMHATNAARHAFAGGKSRKVSIARLRDQVAKKLNRWAAAGSSFEAELRLVQGLPVPVGDSIMYMIPAGLADPARHDSIKRE